MSGEGYMKPVNAVERKRCGFLGNHVCPRIPSKARKGVSCDGCTLFERITHFKNTSLEIERSMAEEEKIVESLLQVDFSGIQIPMAVIYDNPQDHPGMYVCRIWEGVGCHPTDTAIKKASLEELQEDIQAAGFTMRFPRAEDDDPVILETWMR